MEIRRSSQPAPGPVAKSPIPPTNDSLFMHGYLSYTISVINENLIYFNDGGAIDVKRWVSGRGTVESFYADAF